MLSLALKHTSVGRLRLIQIGHIRTMHSDQEVILETVKARLDLTLRFDCDTRCHRRRQILVRAMKVCNLACAPDRALFQSLAAKYHQMLQEKEVDKLDVSSGDKPTPEEKASPK
ncbi:hypothetical protein EC968_010016 [Mortierella alpina]|nr:hypothetical protein EC968_010016 [Mortierella alpina]